VIARHILGRTLSVVRNKVANWVPRGFIFVSVNYRLLPDAAPLLQAEDVARALGFTCSRADCVGPADPAGLLDASQRLLPAGEWFLGQGGYARHS
jgi:hypothetical protein